MRWASGSLAFVVASESACRGSAGPAVNVVTAARDVRTSATELASRAIRSTGGFAEETVSDERFCFPIPYGYPDLQAAPLLCAGLIGFRALKLAGDTERLGLYGFGAAAHIVCQIAVHRGHRVFAFTRPDDLASQRFARSLGAEWAGPSSERPAEELDAAIVFAAAGDLVPAALAAVAKGGTVVCAGIHMSAIPSIPYELLWGERVLRSVANLTRRDGEEFMKLGSTRACSNERHVVSPRASPGCARCTSLRLRSGRGRSNDRCLGLGARIRMKAVPPERAERRAASSLRELGFPAACVGDALDAT